MADTIAWEILEDGTLSVKTDAVSPANHFSADELLKELEDVCGGVRRTEKRKEHKGHVHIHRGQVIHHHH